MKTFPIPEHWAHIAGLDFRVGPSHSCSAPAHDRDADVVYVTHCYRKREATPLQHCETLKAWSDWLPWAWPHDGLQRERQSGVQLKQAYADHGLVMLPEKATFSDGSYGLEAGITRMLARMLERMQAGTLKVFSHLHE